MVWQKNSSSSYTLPPATNSTLGGVKVGSGLSVASDGTLSSSSPSSLAGKKYASFGDSITSDQVSGLGTLISSVLGTTLVGNYAIGYAVTQDWQDTSGSNITTLNLSVPSNSPTNYNVLSNQIRRLLQHTTASGSQITWTHPIDGAFSIDTSIGTGSGWSSDIPDIAYIAMGTNDGENSNTPIVDDTSTVFGQTYSQLTRTSIASALRWAIETLQSAYPNINIFVASPLQTNCSNTWMNFINNQTKRNIIEKVCQFCSVNFVDSFNESGFSHMNAIPLSKGDGIHPSGEGLTFIKNYVANEINNRFVNR